MTTGTNNFLQFNPNNANSEDDSTYSSDTTRVGGITAGAAPTALYNKFFYQISTMVTAIAQIIAARGYDASDVSLNALAEAIAGAFPLSNTSNLANTDLSNITTVGQSLITTLAMDKSLSNITATGISAITNSLTPDYSNGTTCAVNTTYTATKRGVVISYGPYNQYLYINGNLVGEQQFGDQAYVSTICGHVNVGDTYKITGSSDVIKFYPYLKN